MHLLWLVYTLSQSGLPNLEKTFLEADLKAFKAILSSNEMIRVDLRPLLPDVGELKSGQVAVSFKRFSEQFRVHSAHFQIPQSDTNFAWLELYLVLQLEDKKSRAKMTITSVFNFKARKNEQVLTQWYFQDLR